jgi:class 3 adenylate cyclase
MQGLTKMVGRPLLVTATVRERAGDSFVFEELPSQEVRGIEGRIMIFAVTLSTAANPKSQTLNPKDQ